MLRRSKKNLFLNYCAEYEQRCAEEQQQEAQQAQQAAVERQCVAAQEAGRRACQRRRLAVFCIGMLAVVAIAYAAGWLMGKAGSSGCSCRAEKEGMWCSRGVRGPVHSMRC